jgi:hypothetical protein
MTTHRAWLPEIMYEEEASGQSASLPFILVPQGEDMPVLLYMWEHKDTGETEPGPEGEEMPIVQPELRQYARMDVLKDRLTPKLYDKVRSALGLGGLKKASAAGQKITDRVYKQHDSE